MNQPPRIPLCQSEWLQDASIELGRRFVPDHPFMSFVAEVDKCENDGEPLERLTVWALTWYFTVVNLTLWDDRTVWIGVILETAEGDPEYEIGFYPKCAGFGTDHIAEAFRDTVAVSTRLCYGESPLPTLRRIWKHTGEVRTKGMVSKRRTPESG